MMGTGISGLVNLIDLIALGFICFVIARIVQVMENSKQPDFSVPAQVLAKRIAVSGTITYYYVTFEMESGERREFDVSGREFGMLAEGDHGILSCQGTWYKGFVRQRESPES